MQRLVVSLLCLTAWAVPAQTSTSASWNHPLSLADAVALAQERYPAIKAALEQQAAAQNQIRVAKTAYLPRADVLWQVNRATTNKPNIGDIPQGIVPIPDTPARSVTGRSDWNSATGVLFAWQPFDFGVRRAQVDVARFGYQSTQRAADLSRLDVESAATGAFLDLVTARRMVAVREANVQRMESFGRAVHVLVDNTLRPGADASQADAQLAIARTELIQAQTQERVRLEALANLLRIPSQEITLDDKDVLSTAPSDDLQAFPEEAHPAIQQETAVLNQQEKQLHLLRRSWVPMFTLYGSVSGLGAGLSSTSSSPTFQGGTAGLGPNEYNWMAALQVTFPAFQIISIHRQEAVEEAQAGSTRATRQQMIGDVSAQVREARVMLDGARQVAQNTPLETVAARQSREQQQARYQSGLATVIDVSAAEAGLAQAEGDDAVARLNVWRALAGVAEAQGDLKPFLHLLNPHL